SLIEVGSLEILFDKAAPEDIAALRAINDAMRAEETAGPASLQDFRFHSRLVSILGNRQINELYRIMKPVMLRIMENAAGRRHGEENFAEHAAIVDAIEARNRIAYQYRMTMHLEAGLALFEEAPSL